MSEIQEKTYAKFTGMGFEKVHQLHRKEGIPYNGNGACCWMAGRRALQIRNESDSDSPEISVYISHSYSGIGTRDNRSVRSEFVYVIVAQLTYSPRNLLFKRFFINNGGTTRRQNPDCR